MRELGLVECLRDAKGLLTPTYRNPSNGKIKHQMDHLFTTAVPARKRTDCDTGRPKDVFNAGLGDHLPFVADFCLTQTIKTKIATRHS